jgi:hypothetical protein
MSQPRRLLAATLIGGGYGGTTSALNDLSSAYGDLGAALAGTQVQFVLRVISTMTGAGWAWAALAVAVGWYLGTRHWGAAAGALALTAATATYYALDESLRAEPVLDSDIWIWCVAGLLLGMPLGTVGAYARRAGPLGLLAALTVPAGAAVQMVVLPPGVDGVQVAAEAIWARWLVWLISAICSLWLIAHYRRARPAHRAADIAADQSYA